MGLLIDEECVFSHKSSAFGQIFVLSLLLVYWLEQTAWKVFIRYRNHITVL